MNLAHLQETDWEARYRDNDMPWEKGEPSPGLVDFLAAHPGLPKATVCVPGCGTGHDACAWAQAGFEVTGLDIAPSAVQLAARRAGEKGLQVRFQQADFLSESPSQQHDWLFEHTLFCAILPGRREEYVQAVLQWLKPGGQFLAVHYLIPDEEGPPFGTNREEILRRFSPYFDLVEQWVPRSYPNRTGLEWMLWWRRKSSSTEH